MQQDFNTIEQIWQTRDKLVQNSIEMEFAKQTVTAVIESLNRGLIRVCEYRDHGWVVNQWVKKAILLYFQINKSQIYTGDMVRWYDKIPPKFGDTNEEEFQNYGFRIVPGAYI